MRLRKLLNKEIPLVYEQIQYDTVSEVNIKKALGYLNTNCSLYLHLSSFRWNFIFLANSRKVLTKLSTKAAHYHPVLRSRAPLNIKSVNEYAWIQMTLLHIMIAVILSRRWLRWIGSRTRRSTWKSLYTGWTMYVQYYF